MLLRAAFDELGIDVPLPPGESTEITINAPAGEYEYFCTEPGHKDIGMAGTLIVTVAGGWRRPFVGDLAPSVCDGHHITAPRDALTTRPRSIGSPMASKRRISC